MTSTLVSNDMKRFQLTANVAVIAAYLAVVALFGCVHGRHELDKTEEDRKVMESSDKSADEMLQSHPEYLTDIEAVTGYGAKIESRCRQEEIPHVQKAIHDCRDAISNGATEQERRACFRKLYEFEYREFLRWMNRRAKEIAEELTL